jgi:3-dehydroquinate synthase
VFDPIEVISHKGGYSVFFDAQLRNVLMGLVSDETHFLVDSNVARLYSLEFRDILLHKNTLVIDATEENKSIEKIIPIYQSLVENKVRRTHELVAIGGGVVQDITCFVASTLLRGLAWKFIPTTLLSQADSCIGSKSSINLGPIKNILGTYNPPNEIFICSDFLETLNESEIHAGVGEIIKVHAIDGIKSFDAMSRDYDSLITDKKLILKYTRDALLIKKRFIEADEFDQGIRNIFNYGHSFGHAIEAATNYAVPHGIAVTIGMDMANRIAVMRGLLSSSNYLRMHFTLKKNYLSHSGIEIPLDRLLSAITKDKKNTTNGLVLIFPVGDSAEIKRIEVVPDERFQAQCKMFLDELSL